MTWHRVPDHLWDWPGLSPTARCVAAVLYRYRNRQSGQAWPTRDTIGKSLGLTTRTITKALSDLERSGLIKRSGKGKATRYHLPDPANVEIGISVEEPGSPLPRSERQPGSARQANLEICDNQPGSQGTANPKKNPKKNPARVVSPVWEAFESARVAAHGGRRRGFTSTRAAKMRKLEEHAREDTGLDGEDLAAALHAYFAWRVDEAKEKPISLRYLTTDAVFSPKSWDYVQGAMQREPENREPDLIPVTLESRDRDGQAV